MELALRERLPGGRFEGVAPARSRLMSAVRGKGNVTTERRLRLALVRNGLRGWTLHDGSLPGRPDFYFAQKNLAVFVDGCFWHGCKRCGHIPSKNKRFWIAKIQRNRQRDREKARALIAAGIDVIRFWEHELQKDPQSCIEKLRQRIANGSKRRRK